MLARLRPASAVVMAALAAVATSALSGPAGAADLGQPPELEHTADIIPEVPDVFGVYLRGDVGAAIPRVGSVKIEPPIFGRRAFSSVDFTTGATFSVGAGWRFNPWLRSDVTLDYQTPTQVSGSFTCAVCGTAHGEANFSSLAVLANAYVDFPMFGAVTPYVGAGLGMARLSLDDAKLNPAGAAVAANTSPRGGDAWNFAYALMGGVSLKATANTSLDLGYRYLDLGDVSTSGAKGALGTVKARFEGVGSHEIRLGLRYRFD